MNPRKTQTWLRVHNQNPSCFIDTSIIVDDSVPDYEIECSYVDSPIHRQKHYVGPGAVSLIKEIEETFKRGDLTAYWRAKTIKLNSDLLYDFIESINELKNDNVFILHQDL